jgi:hypothetical protein
LAFVDWATVIFCLASKNVSLTGYYESDTPKLEEAIPDNIELVFWSELGACLWLG